MSEFKTPVKNNKLDDGGELITIPPSPFLNRLGYGTGVSVMQLVRSPRAGQIRSPWALKMLNKRVKPSKVYTERLKAEADLLQRMSHPNIVGFRAFSGGKILYLGMEACDVSLGDMIEKRVEETSEPFTPRQIFKIASDIASALDYLHTKMQILHGDVKSYNILVNGDFVICKLCDFGVTLPLDENGVFDKDKAKNAVYFGTEAWSAPEVIHGGEISDKTDIWPLGLTLWEMMALMPPHSQDDSTNEEDSVLCLDDTADTENSERDYFSKRYGTRPPVPAHIPERAYGDALALLCACAAPAPAARPRPPRARARRAPAPAARPRPPRARARRAPGRRREGHARRPPRSIVYLRSALRDDAGRDVEMFARSFLSSREVLIVRECFDGECDEDRCPVRCAR